MAADLLATSQNLADALQVPLGSLNAATATLVLSCATAVVQAAAGGQRIVEVVSTAAPIMGTSDSWLDLPQVPVTAVGAVTMDGVVLVLGTDYKVFGNRLWGRRGWQSNLGWPWSSQPGVNFNTWVGPEPSAVTVTYTHGYAPGAQELELARAATLTLAKAAYVNPGGVVSEAIDDYRVAFTAATGQAMDASPYLAAAIRKQYGRRGALVRIG